MAMDSGGRANALFAAIAASNASVKKMTGPRTDSSSEQGQLQAALQAIFGADLDYIHANAEVPGSQYQAPAGASVATSGGPTSQTGATTSAVTISGSGKVL